MAVIGAGGFLGRSLATALRSAGRPVHEFTRQEPFLVDGGRPADGLARAGTIHFLAGSVSPATAAACPPRAAADVELFERVLDCIRRLGTRPRVVVASSGGRVYDLREPPPYREGDPLAAADAYGSAKLAIERRLVAEEACRGVVARIGNAYGPLQLVRNGHGVVAHWLASAARGEPIVVYGDPDATRDYVYADDVVAALRAAAEHPDPPPVVNVGSGRPTSLRELADLVDATVGGVEVRFEHGRPFDHVRTWLDVGLARDALGWEPRVSLQEGLRRTWEQRRRGGHA